MKTRPRDRGSFSRRKMTKPANQREDVRKNTESLAAIAPATTNESVIVGRHPVLEALRAGRSLQRLWVQNQLAEGSLKEILGIAREKGVVIHEVPRAKLDELAGDLNHQGVVGLISVAPLATLDDVYALVTARGFDAFLIVLDQIQDPQNLGAIIRVANAAGADAVIMPSRNSAPLTPAVRKASAGATEYVPVAVVSNLAQTIETIKKWGIFVYAADPQGEILYTQANYHGPTAIVIGAEGQGIRPLVKKRCDQTVRLPMVGQVASLNAATACAVLAFEVVRQRQAP
ncbi:23S rRNA (guanosine(2251)-2'-O)-methyltransferase RlmB [Sulfobacillus thermosulfidooxidans]|uniref:23S rRNA (guanosine(2251)-2'-O)-methyltransferase RlmB n=1 Tax=Sulfobacillus thermosulfidooxidans TaxID=28034 RepID=UPI0009F8FD3A|nr:23S rRNA (guanosine(2251)-2'-O)-methyltransferase RlmB [Sulfobacillus thermosulfidooxidans]